MSAEAFSALAGISHRKARAALRRCHDGRTWRGHRLAVQKSFGRGGSGGVSYLVDPASLPPELRAKLPAAAPDRVPVPAGLLLPVPSPTASGLVAWQFAVVQRVMHSTKPRSAERADLIRRLAAELPWPSGRRCGQLVSAGTIRQWIARYEEGGIGNLSRKARADRGKGRVCITQRWDAFAAGAGIEKADGEAIAVELDRHLRSLWRTNQSVSLIKKVAEHKLATLTALRIDGEIADTALRHVCELPDNLIRRRQEYRAVGIWRGDAGRSAAVQTPRIPRDRSMLAPMEWVAADVHHVDILVRREDDSLATPKLVAFTDLATNRMFPWLFLPEKREGIRREHTLDALAGMFGDPAWGRPRRLYFDNGSEFNWHEQVGELLKLFTDYRDIRDLAADGESLTPKVEPGVTRSRPYNPQSKVIESLFHSIEATVLPMIPGHIGGDRFRKKTQNQGREPEPFPGTWEEFKAAFKQAFEVWHTKPQRGHLAGQSPNQRFAALAGNGWQAELVERGELEFVFADIITRTIVAGGRFSIDGIFYRHDALMRFAGTSKKVTVRRPFFGDRQRVAVVIGAEVIWLWPEPVFAFGDPAGAVEQGRQQRELYRSFRAMERETDEVNLLAEAHAAATAGPAVVVPMPGAVISVGPIEKKAGEASRRLPPREAKSNSMQARHVIDALFERMKAG